MTAWDIVSLLTCLFYTYLPLDSFLCLTFDLLHHISDTRPLVDFQRKQQQNLYEHQADQAHCSSIILKVKNYFINIKMEYSTCKYENLEMDILP